MKKKFISFLLILFLIFNFSCKHYDFFLKKTYIENIEILYRYLTYKDLKSIYNIKTSFYILSFEMIKNKTYSKYFDYISYFDIKPFNKIKNKKLYYLFYLYLKIKVQNSKRNNLDNDTIFLLKKGYIYKPLNGLQLKILLRGQSNFANKKFLENIIFDSNRKKIEFQNELELNLMFLTPKNFNIEDSTLVFKLNGELLNFEF